MKLKDIKNKIAVFLMLILVLSTVNIPAYAEASNDAEYIEADKTNSLVCIFEEVDEPGAEDFDFLNVAKNITYAATIQTVFDREWEVFSNDYCYQQFTKEEQEYYKRIDACVKEYMNTTKNASSTYYSSKGIYTLSGIAYYDLLELERAKEITYLYIYQNPEYYFVNTHILASAKNMFIMCFDEFRDGETRAEVTREMFDKVDGWIAEASAEKTELDKEKKLHDIICLNTEYNHIDVDNLINQSPYSMIMQGRTVCAGYAKSMSILLNGSGIDAIVQTGSNHAWNIVKINGKWYKLDVTWDDVDIDPFIKYDYFNRSDIRFAPGHAPFSYYNGVVPSCDEDMELPWLIIDDATPTDATPTDATPTDADEDTMGTIISGICQMPYYMVVPGGTGFLIGLESYENPNQSYSYEMLILDCTSMQWIYSTGAQKLEEGKCFWTVWQPQYGYYWTLFRIYNKDGKLIDEKCYGFENI